MRSQLYSSRLILTLYWLALFSLKDCSVLPDRQIHRSIKIEASFPLSFAMSLQLAIPDSILRAIRLPEQRIEKELLCELAVSLYAQDLLSLGKARELAQLSKYEFGQLLAQRGIQRHYGAEELADDLAYARR